MPTLIKEQIAVREPPSTGMPQETPPHYVPLTVEQYMQMAETGILPTTPQVELLDGLLVYKDRRDAGGDILTVGHLHVFVGLQLLDLLKTVLAGRSYHPRHQAPVALPPHGVPEPDVSVVAGDLDDYAHRLPEPADIAAVMEVSYSSLHTDRTTKLERYAAAGIPVYWIVNVEARQVEVFTGPVAAESRYAERTVYNRNETISLPLFDAAVIEVPVAGFVPE